MVRTTISLSESTLRQVKTMSHREHRRLGDVVTELIGIGLQQHRNRRALPGAPFKLKAVSMGTPRIDLEDKQMIRELTDGPKQ